MKLNSLIGYKNGFQLVKWWSLVMVLASLSVVVITTVYLNNKMDKAMSSIWVLGPDGKVMRAEKASRNDPTIRVFEYEDAVRDVYRLWYGYDENSYQRNIDAALELLGDCGKKMKDTYDAQGVLRILRERNYIVSVEIDSVGIDMNADPKRGMVTGLQRVWSVGGVSYSQIDATFTLEDVAASKKNSHGVKLNDWKVVRFEPAVL